MAFIVSTNQMLSMFDTCQKVKTAQECKDLAVSSVKPLVNTYLTAYEKCKASFGEKRCREIMGAKPERICRIAVIVGCVSLIWRILK